MAHDPRDFVQETVLTGLDAQHPAGDSDIDWQQNQYPAGPGANYGRPSQYDGPAAVAQAPMVNPSGSGNVSGPGTPINPVGAVPPQNNAPHEHGDEPYPSTTVGETTVGQGRTAQGPYVK